MSEKGSSIAQNLSTGERDLIGVNLSETWSL